MLVFACWSTNAQLVPSVSFLPKQILNIMTSNYMKIYIAPEALYHSISHIFDTYHMNSRIFAIFSKLVAFVAQTSENCDKAQNTEKKISMVPFYG